ncbi:MAG: DUF3604 domain-containing protein [Spirochaetaceae bacterium]|nr:MAG: DUF3604 domain-containing protein [Spirochaetaceae bacterium]
MKRYWAEIHNHNSVGYAKGTLERAYQIAQSALDIYAFTPHGWWPDLPATDQKVKKQHENGFRIVADAWRDICEKANVSYGAGEFATFLAYEWHSSSWGDFCLYFPDSEAELRYAGDPHELKEFARETHALLVPHHCAYSRGSRGTDWSVVDEDLSPVAEVFSEHGNSLEAESSLGMYGHSMGGSQLSQSILAQIIAGRIIGFTAGTDNHFGAPASYGEGLTAVFAEELTRSSVFGAIRARHTYAVTGDRIGVLIRTEGEGIMGDILPASTPRRLEIDVQGCALLEYVELFRNGFSVEKWNPAGVVEEQSGPYLLRIEFGWGGLNDTRNTHWRIRIGSDKAKILEATPYFCSGPQTIEVVNRIKRSTDSKVEVDAVSTRTNSLPTQTVLLELRGPLDATVNCDISAIWGENKLSAARNWNLAELLADDYYVELSDVFSAPKLKTHRLLPASAAHFACSWDAPAPHDASKTTGNGTAPDCYFFKVVQKNGHMAWTSPVWYR